MASRGVPGSPGNELFLNRPTTDSPTIEPLRIHKREGASPEPPRTGSASSGRQQSYPPPRTYSPPGGPLPYPDNDLPQPQRTESGGRLPYPNNQSPQSPPYASSSPDSGIPQYPRPQTQTSNLAQRRGNAPKPLPDSPGPETPDKEGLFQRAPRRPEAEAVKPQQQQAAYPYNKAYYPPPSSSSTPSQAASSQSTTLHAPNPVNRFGSTASNATTRAQRGSPPPPETPILPGDDQLGGGIEARFAASGIAGNNTMTGLQAQSAAAAQRQNQYGVAPQRTATTSPPQQQDPPRRPWTPTELPGSTPGGPSVVYQGNGQQSPPQGRQGAGGATSPASLSGRTPSAIEEDMQRLHVSGSPPPAYSSVSKPQGATGNQAYPVEKQGGRTGAAAGAAAGVAAAGTAAAAATAGAVPGASAPSSSTPDPSQHPAFANDPYRQRVGSTSQPAQQQNDSLGINHAPAQQSSPQPVGPGPASPPPLPEGWIAHMDPNSGHYYYIHLPTQSTQWEFPKGPTPLNLNLPTSPAASHFGGLQSPGFSTFGKQPLASPGFAPSTPGYAESVMSFQSQTPTVAGFTGPPPTSGVDVYKIAPTNAVYFGPYLRYTNMDIERGLWLGSVMLITDAAQPPTIHIHQSTDLSPNPRQLKANPISKHQRWTFYRYDIDLPMDDHGSIKWTYAITSHLGCTRYEFLVAGRYETSWRFIATSGNDFDLNVSANERSRLGGVGFMWKDIMAKHSECGGFHAQLGLGSQIYADRIWREIPALKQWLAISGKENRKNEPWTARHEEDVTHAFFHYYTSHFDQPFLREAFAQIPHILQIDDHDIFDGFGSYPEYMQFSNMFKNIGRIGIDTYLLFQHHTTLERLRNVSDDIDIFTITGTGWHFIKYLGPAVVIVGPDCRSERNPHQVMAGPTYQGIFPKVATLPPSVQHCIWMVSVPIVYPRLETAESIAHTVATGKKAVTGTYNLLGKVTSSVAGVVGAKELVGGGFDSIKKAVGKSGLMGGVLSPFGEMNMLDEMRDAWTHESKDLERTYLIRTLQGIAQQKSLRMTFLSGGTSLCGAGLVHDPSHPQNHKTMYQLISSSVVNAPPSSYLVRMLHNNKPLYVPANGHRSSASTNGQGGGAAPSDTKEDMMEIFANEPDGRPREYRRLMPRRNYVAIVAYDPEMVGGGLMSPGLGAGSTYGGSGAGAGRLSLAADFICQGEGSHGGVAKYGPVIIPSLEYGR